MSLNNAGWFSSTANLFTKLSTDRPPSVHHVRVSAFDLLELTTSVSTATSSAAVWNSARSNLSLGFNDADHNPPIRRSDPCTTCDPRAWKK